MFESNYCARALPIVASQVIAKFCMLRQQMEKENPDDSYFCQSDFVAPKDSGVADYMGMFAVACFGCDAMVAQYEAENDDYSKIMAQALADRLAEAFAEALHRDMRIDHWGYSEHEKAAGKFDASELHKLNYQGIRPAPGYPSQPDHTEKRTMWDLMQIEAKAGIELSDSLAMMPASAVSALVFGHSKSSYFGVGDINKDQIVDYTKRKVRTCTALHNDETRATLGIDCSGWLLTHDSRCICSFAALSGDGPSCGGKVAATEPCLRFGRLVSCVRRECIIKLHVLLRSHKRWQTPQLHLRWSSANAAPSVSCICTCCCCLLDCRLPPPPACCWMERLTWCRSASIERRASCCCCIHTHQVSQLEAM